MSKVAIISDSHDQIPNLLACLKEAKSLGVEAVLHCGDLCAPFMVAELAENFSGPIHVVLGNNDGDGLLIERVGSKFSHLTIHGIYTELDLFGRKISAIHYPEPARRIVASGAFDLVAYGHDHRAFSQCTPNGWLVNPGELMARFGPPSWGLYDAQDNHYQPQQILS